MIRTAVFLAAALAIGAGDPFGTGADRAQPRQPIHPRTGKEDPGRTVQGGRCDPREIMGHRNVSFHHLRQEDCDHPLIIEGKHVMSLTVWKSDIVRIAYVAPGGNRGRSSRGAGNHRLYSYTHEGNAKRRARLGHHQTELCSAARVSRSRLGEPRGCHRRGLGTHDKEGAFMSDDYRRTAQDHHHSLTY